MKLLLALAICFFAVLQARQEMPEDSYSLDGRYAIIVPILGLADPEARNSVIDLHSGKTVAVLEGETGWSRMNHGGVLPALWSTDSSLLLWRVDGKWSLATLVLLKLEKGAPLWQTNILQAAQEAILQRTREASPKKYAAAKKANAGNGSAYPDGFTIDAQAIEPVALPLTITVTLTSNPKGIPDLPTLESHLEGKVDAKGKFQVTKFGLGRGPMDQ